MQIIKTITHSLTWCCLLAASASAEAVPTADDSQTVRTYHISSGTGFYIQPEYLITNNHVVEECQTIAIRGDDGFKKGRLVANDPLNDLALIKTEEHKTGIASLRSNSDIRVGEKVTVIGYPKEHGLTGKYVTLIGKVLDLEGPIHGDNRIQFSDMVEKGNSGGPLLDASGNIIGVVVGKVNYYDMDVDLKTNTDAKPVKTTGIAINLPTLRTFLDRNNIFYERSASSHALVYHNVEQEAKSFVANIHCVMGE